MHKTYDISVHHALLTEGSSRIVRPSRRRWSSSGDMLQASSLFRGHLRHPFSILLYMRTKPSPSRQRALNRSCFEPQKRNSTSSWKAFIWNCPFTMVESPSIPLRRSVRPHYPDIRINWIILIELLSSFFQIFICFTHFLQKE